MIAMLRSEGLAWLQRQWRHGVCDYAHHELETKVTHDVMVRGRNVGLRSVYTDEEGK